MRVPPPGSGANSAWLPQAGELFTDRESESSAFKSSLASFRRHIDRDDEVGQARHNVLTFYGLGGIGKTALSERLEAWVNYDLPLDNGWGSPPATKVDTTVRIDLHGSGGQIDILATLVALRAGVARLRRRWPVFDLAFAAYWSAVRPGDALPTYRGLDGLSDSIVETLGDVLADVGSLADLAGVGTGSGLAVRGVRRLISELRGRRDRRLAIDAFAGFDAFLMRCADEPSPTEPQPALACEIAGALSWELSAMTPAPLVAVFVDATERLALDPRRMAEGHLNTLIHRMPNVLFVLTGQDMLDWYDETWADLPYRGKWTWPGLVPSVHTDARQHLVGNLSPHDTKTVILRGRRLLDLPISDQVVDELVKASAGLPQYLELARQVAISIKEARDGRQVQVTDVTGSLGSLVMRILDGIPADEQRAVRAACLFRIFDTDLIAAAADVDHGCAERAVLRPMIDRYDGERYPYRMHDAVREAVRRADHQVVGGWSERDWELAATRAAAAARRLHDEAKEREDTREVLDAIAIAIGLVCDQETVLEPSSSSAYADWLSRAIVYSPSIQGLRSRIPGTSRTEYGRQVLNFIAAKSIDTPFEERLRLLRSILDSDHPLRLPAGRHLGYTLRLQHCWDDALAVFDKLVRLDPSPLNVKQRPVTLSMARRFLEARDAADGTDVAAYIRRVGEYAHGRPERYFAEVADKVAKLRTAGRQREYLEDQGDFLMRRAFFTGELESETIDRFREDAELAGHVVAVRNALVAKVLHHQSEPVEVSDTLQRLRHLDQESSPTGSIGFRYALAELCDATLAGSHTRLTTLRAEVAHLDFRPRAWIPIECFLESIGLPLPPMPTQWLEQYEVVTRRWAAHLDSYLARHAGRT
jgi:hypothetical protein